MTESSPCSQKIQKISKDCTLSGTNYSLLVKMVPKQELHSKFLLGEIANSKQKWHKGGVIFPAICAACMLHDFNMMLVVKELDLGSAYRLKKQLKFQWSKKIHDWGLAALEPIDTEDFVIEYVGKIIWHQVFPLSLLQIPWLYCKFNQMVKDF
jgi:hypothetical protein